MIFQISGRLIPPIKENSVVLAVGDIFYEILVPSGLASQLKCSKEKYERENVTLYTIHYLEGNPATGSLVPRLVGFLEPMDREFFELFITVQGLGVKKGLKALVIPISKIASAIENGDVDILKDLPGIGRRMAEKIIAELKGKMAKFALMKKDKALAIEERTMADIESEAMEVLLQLGYKKVEAEQMIKKVRNKKVKSTEDLVREIFHQNIQIK